MKLTKIIICILFSLVLTVPPSSAETDKELIKRGVRAFHSKQYKKAIGILGGTLTSEFNNPLVHYYLANSYMETGKNDAAIREYRIAHALDPNSDIGKFSKQALDNLLGERSSTHAPVQKKTQKSHYDNLENELSKTMNSLDKQTNDAVSSRQASSSSRAQSMGRSADAIVKRTELEMLKSMLKSGKKARLTSAHKSQLKELRRMYQYKQKHQKYAYQQRAGSIKRSSDNLRLLLQESQYQKGQHRLDPKGTGLYIRNYTSK